MKGFRPVHSISLSHTVSCIEKFAKWSQPFVIPSYEGSITSIREALKQLCMCIWSNYVKPLCVATSMPKSWAVKVFSTLYTYTSIRKYFANFFMQDTVRDPPSKNQPSSHLVVIQEISFQNIQLHKPDLSSVLCLCIQQ